MTDAESEGGGKGLTVEDEEQILSPLRKKQRTAPLASPPVLLCGNLPEGSSLDQFHTPPAKVHAKNLEGRSWQEFATQMHHSLSTQEEEEPTLATLPSCQLDSANAVASANKQEAFFKSVDDEKLLISEALSAAEAYNI